MEYNLSFTTGALLLSESKLYLNHVDDHSQFLEHGVSPSYMVFPINSDSSKKKIKSEIDKRLRTLDKSYLEHFVMADLIDQKIILFLAICKTYKIITEFCLEVVYKKWRKFDNEVSNYDFQYFMSSKLCDRQYETLTESTRGKLGQIVIRILKEIGMLDEKGIHPLKPSKKLKDIISESNHEWFFDCLLIQS